MYTHSCWPVIELFSLDIYERQRVRFFVKPESHFSNVCQFGNRGQRLMIVGLCVCVCLCVLFFFESYYLICPVYAEKKPCACVCVRRSSCMCFVGVNIHESDICVSDSIVTS